LAIPEFSAVLNNTSVAGFTM